MASPSLKEKLRTLPTKSGVYIMRDTFGQVIYIGKALNLKKRVAQYFHSKKSSYNAKIASLKESICDIDFIETKSETQALILESKLIKEWKPRYNSDLKDNKNFLLLRVELFRDLPTFTLCRTRKDDNSLYFGPYVSSQKIRQLLNLLKKKFGIISSDAHPKKSDASYHLYDDARADIYSLSNIVTQKEYLERVENAINFLKGESVNLIEKLNIEMQKESEALNFEKAAKLRDNILAIKHSLAMNKKSETLSSPARPSKERAFLGMKEIQKALNLSEKAVTMECFDISHISGSFCVASMVHFKNGLPLKSKYRHFKIKSFIGNDDFKAMNEVVFRRYSKIKDFPDLLLIDGGAGQVSSTLKAFEQINRYPKKIIGLAKREETIVLSEDFSEIKLPKNNEGLKLLQRLRDEAHRFANSFNAQLRSKKIKESILDDFSGLGEKTKTKLLNHFGSINDLKKASIEELSKVDGISKTKALSLFDFLQKLS